MKSKLIILLVVLMVLTASTVYGGTKQNDKYNVVTTTTMLADLTREIGGNRVEVEGLMGPGIDPHLYKASAGDVVLMQKADMVIFNGLHLEGKMGDVFKNLNQIGKYVIEIAVGLEEEDLIKAPNYPAYDPHVWFDVLLWKDAARIVKDGLIELDPANKSIYNSNYQKYIKELDELDIYVKDKVEELPESKRVLITAHDAFEYFGKAYGFEVRGLQGISTATEAGTADVRELANFIVERQIAAIFVESSVPRKNIKALQEAVSAKGFKVKIGGELYSDSLGSPGTEAESYIGTVKSNVNTIVNALK